MADRLAGIEKLDAEVADPDGTDFALVHHTGHLAPVVLNRGADLIRPVDLQQIDRVDAEPAERPLAFQTEVGRAGVTDDRAEVIGLVRQQAALGEDERPVRGGDAGDGAAHDFLGMAHTVNRRRVYPAHTDRNGMPDSGDRGIVVLWTPAVRPAAAADGPGPETHGSDLRPTGSEGTRP